MCIKKSTTKPRQRIVILGGVKYIVHLSHHGKYVFGIEIDFGKPKSLFLESLSERQRALSLLGMNNYQFWQDSQDYQTMINNLKEAPHDRQTL